MKSCLASLFVGTAFLACVSGCGMSEEADDAEWAEFYAEERARVTGQLGIANPMLSAPSAEVHAIHLRNRFHVANWREDTADAIVIHGNACGHWKVHWKPLSDAQAGYWRELYTEVLEKSRFPWRVDEGWTMENMMRNLDGRRIHIHCWGIR